MIRTFLLLLVALAAGSSAPAQSTCDTAFSDSLALLDIRAIERVAALPAIWDDYTLARHPLLFLADTTHHGRAETPVCAAIWRAGVPLQIIELAARPTLSTPVYGMIDLDSIGPRANAEEMAGAIPAVDPAVAARLRELGIVRAATLNVPLKFERLGRFGEMLASMGMNPTLMLADLAIHESFHLHVQFPTWLDQPRTYPWPAWDRQPDRKELRERCYAGTPEIAQTLEQEFAALLAAFDAVAADSTKRDVASGREHARRFVELRNARRALQDTMTVGQGNARISCAFAEDVMELEEGTAQWIGHAATVRAGLKTMASVRRSYAGAQPEQFYRSGPLQLWVLEGLLGEEAMAELTASLARNTGLYSDPIGSLFARFAHYAPDTAQR